MTSWSRAEEKNFQELVRQAEQQSREYYRRAGGKPADTHSNSVSVPQPAPQHHSSTASVPPPVPQHHSSTVSVPPPVPLPLPCLPPPAPECPDSCTPPVPQHPNCGVTPSPKRSNRGMAPLLGGLGIDMETMLLLVLLWLLWQEEADYRVILAIAYILLV